jgi:uncharacterized protein (DUF4213/DUF364 family)
MTTAVTAPQAILQSLEQRFGAAPGPRITELIKPPGGAGERTSPFTVVLLDSGAAGLCWNLLDDPDQAAAYDALDPQAFCGRPALEVAAELLAAPRQRRIVGYAAVNALSQQLFLGGDPQVDTDLDLLDALAIDEPDHVGLVGYAPPVVRSLRGRAGQITVLEQRPDAKLPRDVAAASSPAGLSACDKLLVTSTTLLNDTFDTIAAATAGARARGLYGPGAGILPDALFAGGFTAVGGTLVTDAAALAERQRAGKRWGDAKRKFVLVRSG